MTINKKILKYLEFKGVSQRSFTKTCGLVEGAFRHGDNINSSKLKIVRANAPDLNMDWVLFDEGEMIKNSDYTNSSTINKVEEASTKYDNKYQILLLENSQELIACKNKVIELLNEINTLKEK